MSVYETKPWLRHYGDRPAELRVKHEHALAMARAGMAAAGESPLVHYFETPLSGREVDEASDALAGALADSGIAAGDRIVLQLQNMPQFVIATIAAWKLGAIAVPTNPMYQERELGHVLRDSGARALVCLEELWEATGRAAVRDTDVRLAVTTSPLDFLDGPPPAVLVGAERLRPADTADFVALIDEHRGSRPPEPRLAGDGVAFLVYTSGTTGPPKGAMNLHRNVVFSSTAVREWVGITPDDRILGIAPLFHITGLITAFGLGLVTPAPVILAHRFDPDETVRLVERLGATFTVAAITAFTAMMNAKSFESADLSSFRVVMSGGAPVAPAIAQRWREATGSMIHNAYGLTESTSPTHLVPIGVEAPVDPASGALSVGVPIYDTVVEVIGEDGQPLPPGEIGEIVTRGPQIVPGYWNKPEETANAMPDGRLRTGDVGYMDEDGWFYLVDRSKDLIVASGYNVWPREVEDVLVEHPAVREAAVVGIPDDYRGETVKAIVSLRPGAETAASELVAFCRERMAAYKVPRVVEVRDELPKTITGKILRRELRAEAQAAAGRSA